MTPRFTEAVAVGKEEEFRAQRGWIVIKDHATGKAILAQADTRERALWILAALNARQEGGHPLPP